MMHLESLVSMLQIHRSTVLVRQYAPRRRRRQREKCEHRLGG